MNNKHTREETAPALRNVPGNPVTAWDMVNKYGTYNIQPTSDTENTYPAIAAGVLRHPENVTTPKKIIEKIEP